MRLGEAEFPGQTGELDRGHGDAPVPPELAEIEITSAFACATPAAMVPMPERATSLTQTRALD
jgi:hypothetical protein